MTSNTDHGLFVTPNGRRYFVLWQKARQEFSHQTLGGRSCLSGTLDMFQENLSEKGLFSTLARLSHTDTELFREDGIRFGSISGHFAVCLQHVESINDLSVYSPSSPQSPSTDVQEGNNCTNISLQAELPPPPTTTCLPLCAAGGPSPVPAGQAAWRAAGAQRSPVLPDGSRDGLGQATDVMPAFARGHLGEADGSMSTSLSPTLRSPISTAGSLLNLPGGAYGPLHAFYIQLLNQTGSILSLNRFPEIQLNGTRLSACFNQLCGCVTSWVEINCRWH